MATCKFCSRSGWLLAIDGLGLCPDCAPTARFLLNQAVVASKAVDRARTIETQLRSLDMFEQACVALKPYEDRAIPTLTSGPSHLVEQISRWKSAFAAEEVGKLSALAREKMRSGSTPASKLGSYSSAIGKLTKLSLDFPCVTEFDDGRTALVKELGLARFELALQRAQTEIAKGKASKAGDIVIEAAMELRHDDVPDADQADLLHRARQLLSAMGRDAAF